MQTEVQKIAKKIVKKVKPETFTKDQVEEMVKAARTKAEEETDERVRAEILSEDPPEVLDDSPGLFATSPYDSGITDADEVDDIFAYCEEHFFNKGKAIVYMIQKDGQFAKEVMHPMSWSKIQDMLGGGHYRITAKDMNTKKYLKQQTQVVAEIAKRSGDERPPAPQVIQPPTPQFNPNELLKFVSEVQAGARQEKLSEERLERKSSTESTGLIIELVMKSSQQQQEMMMKMQESTNKMMEKLSDNTNRMMEKMDEKFLRLLDNSKPKESFGMKEYMDMQEKARDREEKAAKAAEDRMRTMFEYIDAKAEEKAEERAENAGDGDSGSMIGSLVKGILPILSTVAQNPAILQPPQQQLAPPNSQPQVRRIPPPATSGPRASGPAITRNVKAANRAAQAPQAKPVRTTNRSINDFGSNNTPTGQEEIRLVQQEQPKTIDQLFAEATPIQQQVAQLAAPIIVENFHRKPVDCAHLVFRAITALPENLGGPKALLKEFSFDFVWQIARSFGIETNMLPWFQEFYAHLEAASNSIPTPVRSPVEIVPPQEAKPAPVEIVDAGSTNSGEGNESTGGNGGES